MNKTIYMNIFLLLIFVLFPFLSVSAAETALPDRNTEKYIRTWNDDVYRCYITEETETEYICRTEPDSPETYAIKKISVETVSINSLEGKEADIRSTEAALFFPDGKIITGRILRKTEKQVSMKVHSENSVPVNTVERTFSLSDLLRIRYDDTYKYRKTIVTDSERLEGYIVDENQSSITVRKYLLVSAERIIKRSDIKTITSRPSDVDEAVSRIGLNMKAVLPSGIFAEYSSLVPVASDLGDNYDAMRGWKIGYIHPINKVLGFTVGGGYGVGYGKNVKATLSSMQVFAGCRAGYPFVLAPAGTLYPYVTVSGLYRYIHAEILKGSVYASGIGLAAGAGLNFMLPSGLGLIFEYCFVPGLTFDDDLTNFTGQSISLGVMFRL